MRAGWSAMALPWVGSPGARSDHADDLQTKARDPGLSKQADGGSVFSQRSVSEKVSSLCGKCAVPRLKTTRLACAANRGEAARSAFNLNRVQFETRSASLPKPPGVRRSDLKSTDLELDAV
jgi:hypothetical protein